MSLSLVVNPAPSPSSAIPLLTTPVLTTEDKLDKLTAAPLRTRQAQLQDARSIHQLIHSFTHDGTLLPRRYSEICENIHTFTVVENSSGQFMGCAALHVYGAHLAEIRSIAVRPGNRGQGAGGLLVRSLLDQAEARGIRCLCLFTRIPGFFKHFDFRVAERQIFRDKVAKDCVHCPRRNACDEIAMAIGELPTAREMPLNRFHPRHQADLVHEDLVQLQV
jgi:amino-acid N-acetyltransferase